MKLKNKFLNNFSAIKIFLGGNQCLVVGLGISGFSRELRSFEIVDLRSLATKPSCSAPPLFPILAPRAISLVDSNGRLGVCGGRQSTTQYNNQCYFLENGKWEEKPNMLEKRYFAGVSTVTFSNGAKLPYVTGGLILQSTPINSASSTEMLTSTGWVFKAALPVGIYSHAQVSVGSQVCPFLHPLLPVVIDLKGFSRALRSNGIVDLNSQPSSTSSLLMHPELS